MVKDHTSALLNFGTSLMGLQLVVEGVNDKYIYTKLRNEAGQITDTCDGMITWNNNLMFSIFCNKCVILFAGDSGGALLALRGGPYEVVATAQVNYLPNYQTPLQD